MKLMYTVMKTEVYIKYVISYNEEYISDVCDIYGWQLLQVMSLFNDKMHIWLAGLNNASS